MERTGIPLSNTQGTSHIRTSAAAREARQFIKQAFAGQDLGGVHFPDGEVSYSALSEIWAGKGGHPAVLSVAASRMKHLAWSDTPEDNILGYSWEQIQRAQHKDPSWRGTIDTSKPGGPKPATPEDIAMLEQHGADYLKENWYGVYDRLKGSGHVASRRTADGEDSAPACPNCGRALRPVWSGEKDVLACVSCDRLFKKTPQGSCIEVEASRRTAAYPTSSYDVYVIEHASDPDEWRVIDNKTGRPVADMGGNCDEMGWFSNEQEAQELLESMQGLAADSDAYYASRRVAWEGPEDSIEPIQNPGFPNNPGPNVKIYDGVYLPESLWGNKDHDGWLPASGGQETPINYNGRRYLYVYNPATGKHGYLNLDTDIMEDEDWTPLNTASRRNAASECGYCNGTGLSRDMLTDCPYCIDGTGVLPDPCPVCEGIGGTDDPVTGEYVPCPHCDGGGTEKMASRREAAGARWLVNVDWTAQYGNGETYTASQRLSVWPNGDMRTSGNAYSPGLAKVAQEVAGGSMAGTVTDVDEGQTDTYVYSVTETLTAGREGTRRDAGAFRVAGALDDFTQQHLEKWLSGYPEDVADEYRAKILSMVESDPDLLNDHGWREILDMAETTMGARRTADTKVDLSLLGESQAHLHLDDNGGYDVIPDEEPRLPENILHEAVDRIRELIEQGLNYGKAKAGGYPLDWAVIAGRKQAEIYRDPAFAFASASIASLWDKAPWLVVRLADGTYMDVSQKEHDAGSSMGDVIGRTGPDGQIEFIHDDEIRNVASRRTAAYKVGDQVQWSDAFMSRPGLDSELDSVGNEPMTIQEVKSYTTGDALYGVGTIGGDLFWVEPSDLKPAGSLTGSRPDDAKMNGGGWFEEVSPMTASRRTAEPNYEESKHPRANDGKFTSGPGGGGGKADDSKPKDKKDDSGSKDDGSTLDDEWVPEEEDEEPDTKTGPEYEGADTGAVKNPKLAADKGLTTEELYKNPDGSWKPERKKFHDAAEAEIMKGVTPVENPVYILMGGGPAAGKSTMIDTGVLTLPDNMASVNSDEIKAGKKKDGKDVWEGFKGLPDYNTMVAANDERAAYFCHEESSFVAKAVVAKSLKAKQNTLLDGTGDGGLQGIKDKCDAARAAGHKVTGHYAIIDADTGIERARERAKKTGRKVPEEFIRKTYANIYRDLPQAVAAGCFDELTLWNTMDSKTVAPMLEIRDGKITIHDKEGLAKHFGDIPWEMKSKASQASRWKRSSLMPGLGANAGSRGPLPMRSTKAWSRNAPKSKRKATYWTSPQTTEPMTLTTPLAGMMRRAKSQPKIQTAGSTLEMKTGIPIAPMRKRATSLKTEAGEPPEWAFNWGDRDYDQPTAEDAPEQRKAGLPVGLGKTSGYDFDVFDGWDLNGQELRPKR